MKKILITVVSLALLIVIINRLTKKPDGAGTANDSALTTATGSDSINTADTSVNSTLAYYYYIPAARAPLNGYPVLVAVPGDANGQVYMKPPWTEFADKNGFVIISPCFRYTESDWAQNRSFQYPDAWAGDALLSILENMKSRAQLDRSSLYFYGLSAGAQFAHRFALMHPESCKAVAMLAPGGVNLPLKKIPVRFYISVGKEDFQRINKAREFYSACMNYGIDADYDVIENQGHRASDTQISRALEYFLETRRKSDSK